MANQKEKKIKMANKAIRITTHLPGIPDWLKIDNSITIPLPLAKAKELAQKLLEVQDDVEIKLSFASGKKTLVEINWETDSK
jgi:hypothetical protein